MNKIGTAEQSKVEAMSRLDAIEKSLMADFFGRKEELNPKPGYEVEHEAKVLWRTYKAHSKEDGGDFLTAGDFRLLEANALLSGGQHQDDEDIEKISRILKKADEDYQKGFTILVNRERADNETLIDVSARITQRTLHRETTQEIAALVSKRA